MEEKVMFSTIKAEMARKGLTREKLAKMLKISGVSVWHKMTGQRQWKKNEIDIMMKYFNKTYEQLFKEE